MLTCLCVSLEATPVHQKLFDTVKAACVEAEGGTIEEDVEEGVETGTPDSPEPRTNARTSAVRKVVALTVVSAATLLLLWWQPFGGRTRDPSYAQLEYRISELESELKLVKTALEEVLAHSKQS